MAQPAFNKVGDQFIAYYDQVRGHVRQEVTWVNLAKHLPPPALKILDVGGGDGRDALWLAKQGHQVTLIDPSQKMINKAKRRFKDTPQVDQLEVVCGDPQILLADVVNKYDAVLSHGVLMYLLERASQHLSLLSRVVKPRGIVSILTKGKPGSIQRLINRKEFEAAIELETTNRMSNNLGEEVLAVSDKSMNEMLQASSLKLKRWYGVRIVTDTDFRPYKDVSGQQLQSFLTIEKQLSVSGANKGMGQMLHFIATKE